MNFSEIINIDTLAAAKALLGMNLSLNERTLGTIIETEAYLFPDDAANHSFAGKQTSRNHSMYLDAGHWYVYQVYGHQMLNLITRPANIAEGILIRALELPSHALTANGPGKLTRVCGIDKKFDGQEMSELTVSPYLEPMSISSRSRIGLNCEEPWKSKAYNFYVTGHYAVSKIRKSEVQKKFGNKQQKKDSY